MVKIPSHIRLKALGRLVKNSPAALAKQLPAYHKRSKKIECELGGHPHLFQKLSDVVVPYAEAAQLAERAGFRAELAEHEPDLLSGGPAMKAEILTNGPISCGVRGRGRFRGVLRRGY